MANAEASRCLADDVGRRIACPDDAALSAFLLGRMDEATAERLEEIVLQCRGCADRCERIDADDDLVLALAGSWDPATGGAVVLGGSGDSTSPGLETTAATDQSESPGLTGEELVDVIGKSRLLSKERVAELLREVQSGNVGDAPFDQLIAEQLLTPWQLAQLRTGHTSFYLDNDRYVLLDLIGKGGMGAVYRARHTRMNRAVALKLIRPRGEDTEKLVRRFEREVAVTSKLQHEHIVQAWDVGTHKDVSFLVLEYVEGADLATLVKRDGPLAADEAAAVCLQAASGLAYAHAAGVVHRDVKPHNILLSTAGVTKILDLGLARTELSDEETALTQEGTVMGTIDFMAPEQGSDTRAADPRSDVYSLGATLYYLLAARPPFPGGTAVEKLHRLATEAPQVLGQLRPDLPREVTEVVVRMMARNPAQRLQSMEQVVQELSPLAAETLAGRAVVTASVRAAAEASHAKRTAAGDASAPTIPFDASSVAESWHRKHKSRPQAVPWIVVGSVLAIAAALLLVWKLGSRSPSSGRADRSEESQRAEAPTPVPPTVFRVLRNRHFATIRMAAWSPDGSRLATSGTDGEIRVWSVTTAGLDLVAAYRGHASYCIMRWTPDGKAIGSRDHHGGPVHVWDAATGRERYRISEPAGVREFVFVSGGELVYVSGDFGTGPWSIKHRRLLTLPSKKEYGTFRISPDGRWLATESGVFDLLNDEQFKPEFQIPGITAYGRGYQFLDEDRLVSINKGTAEIWSCSQRRRIDGFAVPTPTPTAIARPGLSGATLSQNGRWFVVNTPDGLRRFDVRERTAIDRSTGAAPINFAANSSNNPAVSSGGRYLCGSAQTTTRQWAVYDLSRGKAHFLPWGELPETYDSALAADKYLHTQWTDDLLKFSGWNLSTGRPLESDFRAMHVTSAGKTIVERGGTIVQVTPDSSERVLAALDDATTPSQAGFLQDGKLYWHWYDNNQKSLVRLWDAQSGRRLREIDPPNDGKTGTFIEDVNGAGEALAVGLAKRSLPDQNGEFEIQVHRKQPAHPVRITLPAHDLTSFSIHRSQTQLRVALSSRARRVAAVASTPDNVVVFGAEGGKRITAFNVRGIDVHPPNSTRAFQVSASGRFVLLNAVVFDIDAAKPHVVWRHPRTDFATSSFWAHLFENERRILLRVDDRIEIWDWRSNEKLVTIFLLPKKQWLFMNHKTHHHTSSRFAHEYIHFRAKSSGGREVWIDPLNYEEYAHWKNDESKAGLALPKESNAPRK